MPARLYLQEPVGFTSEKFCDVSNIEQIISPRCPHHPKFSPLCISDLEEWKHYILIAKDRELEVVLDSFLPIALLIQSITRSYRYPLFISPHLYCHCLGSGSYLILPNRLPYIQPLSSTIHPLSSGHSNNNRNIY